MILPFLFQAVILTAQAQLTAPLASKSVSDLHDDFIESVDNDKKGKVLDSLKTTAPTGTRDIQSLFDLFMRFSESQVRDAALSSLQLMNFQSPDLDILLLHYLQQPDPEAQIFAIKGAVRVRDAKALPLIQKLADRKFSFKSANDAAVLSEKNEWWVQYEALSALAQWTPEVAVPLLVKRTDQAPEVARIMGQYLWKDSLPTLVKWAQGTSTVDVDRAHAGLAAPAPQVALRATREAMLAILRDPKAPREARHQLAIKVGISSTPEEVAELLKEHAAQKTDEDKLMFKAALFASMDKQVAPMLISTVKEDINARNRAGALIELKDMLTPKELRPVLDWMLKNDPDPDNHDMASRELKLLPR